MGFDLHPMCGFEYLHPVQLKRKEPTRRNKLKTITSDGPVENETGSDGTIYAEESNDGFDKDDPDFDINENRLEDIYQDIKTDLVKA